MVFYFVLNLNLWNIGLNDESIVGNALPSAQLNDLVLVKGQWL